jgi:uroporphyrinogen-III synthase
MRWIITRPEQDVGPLSAKLMKMGHDPVVLSLLKIIPRTSVNLPDLPWQAICFTSANAPRTFAARDQWQNLPVFTVGPQSKSVAQTKGYRQVTSHGGDVDGLYFYLSSHLKPEAGPILYLSGSATSGDLAGKLKSAGYTVHREITYDAIPNTPANLGSEITAADGVLLYSPRTAQNWIAALASGGQMENAARLRHVCLSANVAARLPRNFNRQTAATPDEDSMLTLLDQAPEQE